MNLNVRHDIGAIVERLRARLDQVPYATKVAINELLEKVRPAEYAEMSAKFDRPNPYTLNSIRIEYASKTKLWGRDLIKDKRVGSGVMPENYLLPQIAGGNRKLKRFERALQRIGAMPVGMWAVPGKGAPLDAYGNVMGGKIQQMLAYLQAYGLGQRRSNMTGANRKKLRTPGRKRLGIEYVVIMKKVGRLLPGIWIRTTQTKKGGGGSKMSAMFIFVSKNHYKPRLDFVRVGRTIIERDFDAAFERAMRYAMANPQGGRP